MTESTSFQASVLALVAGVLKASATCLTPARGAAAGASLDRSSIEKQLRLAQNLGRVTLRSAQRTSRPASAASATATSKAVTPVADYDNLTAPEVIAIIATADAPTRRWIRHRENETKSRVTVLRALDRQGNS